MIQDSWQVTYPQGMIKFIDYFRNKYLQYEIFDKVLVNYINKHICTGIHTICSLGSGTGRHEVELAKMGFKVIGLERNEESLEIAEQYIKENNVSVEMFECDFLKPEDVDKVLRDCGSFDVLLLLYIPASTTDYRQAVHNLVKYLTPGGIFVTDFFDYAQPIDTEQLKIISDIEVASSPRNDDYAVRLNYYEYFRNIANWDAIYLFQNEDGNLRMGRDHDILEITPYQEGVDPLHLDVDRFELLPPYHITELHESVAPPYLNEYLVGWIKKMTG